jgi:hypothetical protein
MLTALMLFAAGAAIAAAVRHAARGGRDSRDVPRRGGYRWRDDRDRRAR